MATPPNREEAARNGRGDGAPVRSEVLREVNERVREVGRDGHGSLNSLEFICECGDGGCVAMVELPIGEYDHIRLGTGLVLAVGHAPAWGTRTSAPEPKTSAASTSSSATPASDG